VKHIEGPTYNNEEKGSHSYLYK